MGAEGAPMVFPCPCCLSSQGPGSWPLGTCRGLGKGHGCSMPGVWYVDWNLRSQLTPRMEVWGVWLCGGGASVHPQECSCW